MPSTHDQLRFEIYLSHLFFSILCSFLICIYMVYEFYASYQCVTKLIYLFLCLKNDLIHNINLIIRFLCISGVYFFIIGSSMSHRLIFLGRATVRDRNRSLGHIPVFNIIFRGRKTHSSL